MVRETEVKSILQSKNIKASGPDQIQFLKLLKLKAFIKSLLKVLYQENIILLHHFSHNQIYTSHKYEYLCFAKIK